MPRSFPQYSMEFLILYFVLWSTTSATNLPNNTFINPQPATDVSNHSASVSWPLNSNQTIQWNSNMTTYELWLYQVNDLDQNGTGSLICTRNLSILSPSRLVYTKECRQPKRRYLRTTSCQVLVAGDDSFELLPKSYVLARITQRR